MILMLPSQSLVLNAYAVLVGQTPGNAALAEHQAYITANGEAGYKTALNNIFANYTTASLATTLLANLGLGSVFTQADAEAYLTQNASNRVAAMMDLASALYNYAGDDAGIVAAKTTYSASIESSYNYSIDTANTTGTTLTGDVVSGGQTFTLTASADTLSPTSATAAYKTSAGDDTFRAPTDGFLGTADYIDAGGGTDTLTATIIANSQTIAPVTKNLENITLTITAVDAKTTTFDATDVTGATTVTIKGAGAVSMAGSDELITVSNLAKTTTLGIEGGTASTGVTASEITATFASAAAADTQKVAISTLGKVGVLTLSTAETVEITATGTGTTGANAIGSLAATAVKTLNIKGAGDLTIAASDLAAAVTINASTSTGVIAFTGETAATSTTFTGGSGNTTVTTASTGTVAITTGAGNDTVDVSAGNSTGSINVGAGDNEVKVGASSNVTTADTITAGSGTADTITVSDTAINATTKTNLTKGITGFEYVKTTATAEVTVDFNALSTWNTVIVAGASGATGAVAATAGNASIAATIENADSLVVAAARVGQAGGVAADTSGVDTSAVGGNGITLTPKLDGGANAATLKFIGNAYVTGGAGGASAGSAGGSDVAGAGGVGLSADTIESLSIEVVGTNATGVAADTVTIAGGAGGAATDSGDVAGAAGSSVVVEDNATITITDSLLGATAAVYNNLNLGTVIGTNVIINASTFHGVLTATAASGNVQITGGSGKDVLTGGAGIDTINGGSGADTITGGDGADILTGGAGRDAFVIGTAGHSDTTNYDTIADFGKVTIVATATEVGEMDDIADFQSATLGKGGAEADLLQLAATATLGGAQTATDVSGAGGDLAGKTVTAVESAKGIITVSGADAALVNTLAEWAGIANIMAVANGDVVAFEFDSNTYVFQQAAGGDDLIQLTGVTGVTGITLINGAVASAVGDIFVL